MANFTIYSKDNCPFCVSAKTKLSLLGHTFEEKDVLAAGVFEELLRRVPNAKTVPQIFIGEYRIGGYTDMEELIQKGTFDLLVEANS